MNNRNKLIGRLGLLMVMLGEFSQAQPSLTGHFEPTVRIAIWVIIFVGSVLFVLNGI